MRVSSMFLALAALWLSFFDDMEADFLITSAVPATATSLELADLVDSSISEWLDDGEGVPAGAAVAGPITQSQSSPPPRVLGHLCLGTK